MAPVAPEAEGEEMASHTKRRPTVAVIGCGPAGMFFLHAVATRRRMMEEAGDSDGLNSLPIVTCYERTSSAGGVWRAERSFTADVDDPAAPHVVASASLDSADSSVGGEDVSTNMYEALWTNGAKECIEFFDYTYDDHFGVRLPTYMPREHLLEYFISRVTRNNPNFFDDVQFDTSVLSVTYDDAKSKFTVVTKDNGTGETSTAEYDKCIWAAGENGRPNCPRGINAMLEEGFLGNVKHSSQVGDLENDVKDKRVLLVGDAYSAEDIALQAIKLGAEKVYIYSRSGDGIACSMASWPMDKVEMIESMMPTDVIQGGRGIRFEETTYDTDTWDYVLTKTDGETLDLHDISAVIYCTGYKSNLGMLDESLRLPFVEWNEFEGVPTDWKMASNSLSDDLGDVTPYQSIDCYEGTVCLGIYRGVLMSNPNMMFIQQFSSAPLFEIDVNAWLCLAYITGDVEIPSPDIMEQRNAEQILDEMDVPVLRYAIDGNYFVAFRELEDSHWSYDELDERTIALNKMEDTFHFRLIARNIRDAGYPSDIGTYEKLNERGEALVNAAMLGWYHRITLPTDGPDTAWKTFRDGDPSKAVSIHTGTKAAPLKKHWLDLAEDAYDELLKGSKSVHTK